MNTPTLEQLISRCLWLAFQASTPIGMGFIHVEAAKQQTEESLYKGCIYRDPLCIDTDYVHGRMMKTTFSIKDGKLVVMPENPRGDYQSWCLRYDSASDLISATHTSFLE